MNYLTVKNRWYDVQRSRIQRSKVAANVDKSTVKDRRMTVKRRR